MLIRWATSADKAQWVLLAADVAEIFGAPDMPENESFGSYADSKIAKYEALVAVDRMSGKAHGVIGFSRANNRISWFGVFEDRRGKGIGSKLLQTALRQLDTTQEISVVTFCGDYAPGIPARVVYEKFGFAETALTEYDGQRRSVMTRPPSGEKL
jgi:GNAT superfamily N-acetyltransferase